MYAVAYNICYLINVCMSMLRCFPFNLVFAAASLVWLVQTYILFLGLSLHVCAFFDTGGWEGQEKR